MNEHEQHTRNMYQEDGVLQLYDLLKMQGEAKAIVGSYHVLVRRRDGDGVTYVVEITPVGILDPLGYPYPDIFEIDGDLGYVKDALDQHTNLGGLLPSELAAIAWQ